MRKESAKRCKACWMGRLGVQAFAFYSRLFKDLPKKDEIKTLFERALDIVRRVGVTAYFGTPLDPRHTGEAKYSGRVYYYTALLTDNKRRRSAATTSCEWLSFFLSLTSHNSAALLGNSFFYCCEWLSFFLSLTSHNSILNICLIKTVLWMAFIFSIFDIAQQLW